MSDDIRGKLLEGFKQKTLFSGNKKNLFDIVNDLSLLKKNRADLKNAPPVTMVTSLHRHHHINNCLNSHKIQSYKQTESIIVAHGDEDLFLALKTKAARSLPTAKILHVAGHHFVGRCWNEAVSHARSGLIAKIDSDDLYGKNYIADGVQEFLAHNADLVTRAAHFVLFENSRAIRLFNFDKIDTFVSTGSGATIFFKKSVWEKNRFVETPEPTMDKLFYFNAHAAGARIYASHPYGFIVKRSIDPLSHTWKIHDRTYCKLINVVAGDISLAPVILETNFKKSPGIFPFSDPHTMNMQALSTDSEIISFYPAGKRAQPMCPDSPDWWKKDGETFSFKRSFFFFIGGWNDWAHTYEDMKTEMQNRASYALGGAPGYPRSLFKILRTQPPSVSAGRPALYKRHPLALKRACAKIIMPQRSGGNLCMTPWTCPEPRFPSMGGRQRIARAIPLRVKEKIKSLKLFKRSRW